MLSPANDSYLHHPTLHGDLVGFLAHDDVWLAPVAGGRAWQVTADAAPTKDLRFSPDGTHLAHLSQRDGAPELHVVPAGGGESVRTTWWGDAGARVLGWADATHVHVATAWREPFRNKTWARSVPLDGGASVRLPHGPVTALDVAADGATVLGTGFGGRRRDPGMWKRYRGGTAGRLWVDATGGGEFTRLLPELTAQLTAPMWVAGRVAFLSDHEGVGNVYSVTPDGADLRRHTDHADFYARHASTDGARVVYAVAGELWVLDGLDADSQPHRLDLRTGGPRSARTAAPVAAGKHLGEVAVAADGRASAVEVRGSIQWVTHADGPVRTLAAGSGVRARLPRLLGPEVVWVDDATGEDGLVVSDADGTTRRTLAAGELGRVVGLAAAPDGSSLAVGTHDGRLLLVAPADGAVRELASTRDGTVEDLVFSPDSAWLAWSHPDRHDLSQIRLARPADGVVHDASPLRFADTEPVFTLDGKHLAFLSTRTFDPVYDEHVFDLGFPAGTRPQLLALAAATPSPFAPSAAGRGPAPQTGPDDGPPAVVVDVEGLTDRAVAVPVPAGRYSGLRAVEGGLVWLREGVHGVLGDARATPSAEAPRPTLERLTLATGVTTVLAEGVDDVRASGDGTRLVVRDGESLRSVPAGRKASADAEKGDPAAAVDVDLGRLRVLVRPTDEWHQMLDEAWRLMRDHFWVADMAGNDWPDVLDRYRPLVERLATRDDLSDLIWEVQGELGTSHAYETPPERPATAAHRLGHLGVDLDLGADGLWRIARVLPGEPSAATGRSPLRAPGVGAVQGCAVVAVDGRGVDAVQGPGPLLVGTAGTPVELRLRAADGAERTVVVVPVGEEAPLRYFDWVAERRAVVHAATGGRVGYLHVPDMMGGGWAQLHRDLHTQISADAVLLDVRSNGGGHTSQLVVEKLARRLTGWSVPRGKRAGTYPDDVRRGPMVTITDENAGSDGDIVTAMIQERGLGPVVGMRSWGGVVGIDGKFRLVDGTAVTQPRYATWIVNRGWSVENHGVDPDVEVPVPPQAWAAGLDPQLDTALELVLAELERSPAAVAPTTDDHASTAPGVLPPRP
ncbi:PDZ domain-containing protein [Rhodococcus antarcticus]|uniref:Tricorn protease homolog n=1 Tax=Rhodococcus antarcticus TaxID=2987751 RepID=A0ABY6P0U2_9NOCA|nr:S41 family peptidase [Rhodococcus antarcticus]UZJ25267.1 PDZ domain-containing protein [Rhodococcus antarcticus]